MKEHFQAQIDSGTDTFFYGVEVYNEGSQFPNIEIKSHKDTLDNFPDLVYVRDLSDNIPLFKSA